MTARRDTPGRRRAYRRPRARVLVLCGGERTEPDYLRELKSRHRNPAVVVKVLGRKDAPTALVAEAHRRWSSDPESFDEVWCVIDVDEFDVESAARLAAEHGVLLAVSNPCFELWLLLHHEDRRAAVADADEAVRRLRRRVRDYDKAALNIADFAAGVEQAVVRARRLDDGTTVGPNPSSGVWRLVEKIVRDA